jgi:xanthine dehydrogenase YagS FAD-binding subunit
MFPFSLEKAHSTREAVHAAITGARLIAGGTTLIDLMREEVERPKRLVDINALPMAEIRAEGADLIVGAVARMADVAAHPDTRRLQPLIVETLIAGASPQLRNMASIGGNLLQRVRCPYFRLLAIDGVNGGHAILGTSDHCIAAHPSDLAVSLVALDATMRVQGPDGERIFPVEELFRLPDATPHLEHTLRPGELITQVHIPGGPHAHGARYLKVRDRSSYEFALVSAAAALHIEDGVIRAARLACGGVGTRPWRMRASEAALVGQAPNRQVFETAARLALDGATPREGNRFKLELLPRTMVRALEMAGDIA